MLTFLKELARKRRKRAQRRKRKRAERELFMKIVRVTGSIR
ncbi:hypothetical protein [Thermincola ferriacetica]